MLTANPNLALTRQESDHLGELSLATKDYTTATDVYTKLLNNASPTDPTARGFAYYGLGAAAMGQNDLPKAKEWFVKLKQTPSNGLWHPHIQDAKYGIARADELSGSQADLDEAKATYGALMQATGNVQLQAEGFLGYGRLLEKAGFGLKPATAGTNETALFYYLEPNLLYGPSVPLQSAEGLYRAGQLYDKAGDKANAKAQYDLLIKTYDATAPEWSAKAKAAMSSS